MTSEKAETLSESTTTDKYVGGPVADLAAAPLPTDATLRARKSLIPQFVKFVGFDLTIMRMVLKGHSHD